MPNTSTRSKAVTLAEVLGVAYRVTVSAATNFDISSIFCGLET